MLLPELYLHGLADGSFDVALWMLLGGDAPMFASTVTPLKEQWQGECGAGQKRTRKGLEVVNAGADGVYVRGLKEEKAAVAVVSVGCLDRPKVVASFASEALASLELGRVVLWDLHEEVWGFLGADGKGVPGDLGGHAACVARSSMVVAPKLPRR